MRKDIRFGLTVGASLVAVLVIWVAIDRLGQKGTREASIVSAPPADESAPGDNSTPVVGGDHLSDTASGAGIASSGAAGATTQPSASGGTGTGQAGAVAGGDSSAGSSTSTARDWNRLLEAGGATTEPSAILADVTPTTVSGPATRPASSGSVVSASVAGASVARTHKVAAGESFYTISAAVYGDSKYYTRLEDANPTVDAGRLRVGTVLNVPDLKSQPVAIQASATIPKASALDPSRSYRVRSSDTLMAIARKLYGNGQEWEKIYDANRDAIGPNPARLKVDMVLRLPDPPTLAAATN